MTNHYPSYPDGVRYQEPKMGPVYLAIVFFIVSIGFGFYSLTNASEDLAKCQEKHSVETCQQALR